FKSNGFGKRAVKGAGVKVQVAWRGHFFEIIPLAGEKTFVSVLAPQPSAEGVVRKKILSVGRKRGVFEAVGNTEVSLPGCSVGTGVFKADTPRLALEFFAAALGWPGELQRNQRDAALPEKMALTVAGLIRVTE